MEYERITEKRGKYIALKGKDLHLNEEYTIIKNRLAELEDKIENGTLVEFPRIVTYTCYYSGIEKYVVEWIDNGRVRSRTYWSEKRAVKRLKELRDENSSL